jgi:molybdopterin synthase sulfur carrier subunit
MLKILLFGRLGDAVSDTEIGIPWDEKLATVATVREHLARTSPELAEALGETRNLVAINQQICGTDTPVNDGDEIAFMPPVTGG